MKTIVLFENNDLTLEKFEDNTYRITIFKDNHWNGDFNFDMNKILYDGLTEKKHYEKPLLTPVNISLVEDYADEFSMCGQMLTGSVKDKSSGISGVKEESIFEDEETKLQTNNIWEQEW